MRNDKENIIVKISFDFALKIIEFAQMHEENRQWVIAKQILRSVTSI